jgi:hypothetical protein
VIDFAGGSYAAFFGTYTKQTDTANDFSAYKADVGTWGIWYTGSSWIIGTWTGVGGGSGNAFNSGDSICVHDMTAAWAWTYYDWNTNTSPAAGQGLGIRCTDTTPTAGTPTPTVVTPTPTTTIKPPTTPTQPPTEPTPPPPPNCGKLNGPSGTVKSPGYPEPPPAGMVECQWKVKCDGGNKKLYVKSEVGYELDYSCEADVPECEDKWPQKKCKKCNKKKCKKDKKCQSNCQKTCDRCDDRTLATLLS